MSMADWTSSMQQTFEYYVVNPNTWQDERRLDNVKKSTINRDLDAETLYSATIDIVESVGECYIRIYLVTIQNGIRERHPLGTFLVQTPSSTFDGKIRNVSMDAYSPLLELKESKPPIGYYIPKTVYYKVTKNDDGTYVNDGSALTDVIRGNSVMNDDGTFAKTTDGRPVFVYNKDPDVYDDVYYCTSETADTAISMAYKLISDNEGKYKRVRAPVIPTDCDTPLTYDFVADPNDTWLSYIRDLISGANYSFDLDEMGRILFIPYIGLDSMQPIWTYDDSNSSILYPELTMDHDLYGIPNVVEIVYYDGIRNHHVTARNDDPNSPISTASRGREIIHRITTPDLIGLANDSEILKEYARQTLKDLSTIEYTLNYKHGYCQVRVGDCVRLNYSRAGLTNIKAKVVSQSITCEPGCPVTEKAIFTANLLGEVRVIDHAANE